MRLLEPVAGIKTAQGHALFHLVFFIMMWNVSTNICDKPAASQHHNQHAAGADAHNAQQDPAYYFTFLNDKHEHAGGHKPSNDELVATECQCFTYIKWSHFTTFVLQMLYLFLKLKEYYNFAQFIQGVLVPFSYFMGIFYTIFVVKGHKDLWKVSFSSEPESMQMRSWLILEVILFFTWIWASIFFLLFAYIFKLESVAKNEAAKGQDDNVWNDRGSDDFLRYLKFEYFMFTFLWCKLFMELSVGYFRFRFDDIEQFGPVKFYPQILIIIILTVHTVMQAAITTTTLRNAEEASAKIKDLNRSSAIIGGGSQWKMVVYIIVWLCCFGAVVWLYFWHDQFKKDNIMIKQWIEIEMLVFCMEIPFIIMQYKFMSWRNEINEKNFLENKTQSFRLKHKSNILKSIEKHINSTYNKNKTSETEALLNKELATKNQENSSQNEGGQEEQKLTQKQENVLMDKVKELQEYVESKDVLLFKADFFSLTALSFLQKNGDLPTAGKTPIGEPDPHNHHKRINKQAFGLKPEKLAQMLYSNCMIAVMILTMVGCLKYQLQEDQKQKHFCAENFNLFIVKFPCCIALHLALCPEVAKGMELMKFANNHPTEFVEYGSEIAYMIGLAQALIAGVAEMICVLLLVNQELVDECIVYFLALKVLIEVSKFYFDALLHVKCKEIAFEKPKVTNHASKGVELKDRSTFHRVGRVLFKMLRGLFVSVFYYYYPFFVFFGEWDLPVNFEKGKCGLPKHH